MKTYFSIINVSVVALFVTVIATLISADSKPDCRCIPQGFCPADREAENLPQNKCPEGETSCCTNRKPDLHDCRCLLGSSKCPKAEEKLWLSKFDRPALGCLKASTQCCIDRRPKTTRKPTPKPKPTTPPPQCGIQKTEFENKENKTLASFGEFPWMVRISGKRGNILAVGVLIGAKYVLTVAHPFASNEPYRVSIGDWNTAGKGKDEYKPVKINVESFLKHPQFDLNKLQNDIGLITLSSPVDLNADHPNIGTACLPTRTSSFANQDCSLSTYGSGSTPNLMKRVVPVVSHDDCEDILKDTVLGGKFVLDGESFLCAGGTAGKDVCQEAYTGAPLVCKKKIGFVLAGLGSWGLNGFECNKNKKFHPPSAFVNIQTYLEWIKALL